MASSTQSKDVPDEVARHITTPSLARQFHGDASLNKNTIHVLQWNVLAQALSYTKNNFVRVSPETVAFESRKWRILEQIIVRKPDLCALEEMDIYDAFLKDELPKYGYKCHFVPKINSKCLLFQEDKDNFKGPDGTLLCYKVDVFTEINRESGQIALDGLDEKHIFALLELKHIASCKKMVFIGTHLKARKQFANSRSEQVKTLIQHIKEKYSSETHVILMGDFNGEHSEPFYSDIMTHGFKSAYRTILKDREPDYTTWKIKGRDGTEKESRHTIDYIFYYPNGFKPKAILEFPEKEAVGANAFPSAAYPSDHLALEAIFDIL